MKVRRWLDKDGPLGEESARALYQPEYKYRVFRREIPEASRFAGEAEGRTLVGLQGRFLIAVAGDKQVVEPGDLVDVPEGEFLFACEGPVAFLAVYRLPPETWPN
ncbi:MAG: hypothetical protein HY904_08895 [Deltaproteobacteria bacterium]|nr:hypothetical protein [Deltaproteobacteria bacterium]